ncbi:MAG: FmdB family zinc ribbon protein [Oligoflexales bacterium]
MPIYEYKCRICLTLQENLILNHEIPACIKCGSFNLEKQFSLFSCRTKTFSHDTVIPSQHTDGKLERSSDNHSQAASSSHCHTDQKNSCSHSHHAEVLLKKAEKLGVI